MREIQKPNRLLSLDVFRGITIVLMILVNSPGNKTPYSGLEHSAWDGCTLADVVFPFFIFIVGVTLVFSLRNARTCDFSTGQLVRKITQRSLLIFLMGLFLNAFPYHFDFATIRVFGVLQRIALCYFFSACLFLTTSTRTQCLIFLVLLVGYWLLFIFYPVPGFGANQLTPEANLAAYLDRSLFTVSHLYGKIYDPEGLLSTMPAVATALLGNLTGIGLCSTANQKTKLNAMLIGGALALVLGWCWSFYFPLNKALWTSSYTLWTGGLALLLLGVCYWLIEMKGLKRWSKPFEIFGVNAMAAYVLHIFFLKLQLMIAIPQQDGSPRNVRSFITEHLWGWASPQNAALFYAISYTALWFFVLYMLYRKKIYIRL